LAVLREDEFEGFLKRRSAAMNGILIHGNDEAAVSLLARQAAAAAGGAPQLTDAAAMKAAPGQFLDALLSLSMFGDRTVLLVEGADEHALKFLAPAFAHEQPANFAVITAAGLGKTSKLRAAAENARLFASLAVYEEDEERLKTRARAILAADNLRWAEGAEEAFFQAVGAERAIVKSEAEKLALYAHGKAEVTVADVAAICGDTAEFEADEVIDALLAGDMEGTDRMLAALGDNQRSLFPLLQLHLARLQNFHLEMEKGTNADGAVRNARPPVFFKRQRAIIGQLRRLSMADLVEIQDSVQQAVLASRRHADLAAAITSRALLSVARLCRSRTA